ncbi:hypothetical protein [Deinococcus sp. Leaf326]|uniref:hypothetical protein n=1 Tax=Deinococcus sp. Leaf326 TaxID=1736338 RepID=UPI0006F87643|nr:hypothetical protein [Deinococcus sp. Leaf326]KQR40747.1 hypothetical protein ASF71_00840 [Deinococcus sp. Leaf326]
MSALAIRRLVERALAEAEIEVGTYRLPDGEETPAVYLGNPPEGTTARGLEVVVSPTPKKLGIEAFKYPGMPTAYPVRLVNWDGLPDVLEDAINAIAGYFWPFEETPKSVPVEPEQYVFALFFDPEDPELNPSQEG